MKDLSKIKEKKKFKHHFLPCPVSKKRATLLHHNFFLFYSAIFLFFLVLINASKTLAPGVLGYASDIKVSELLKKTNEYRIKNGKKELVLNEKLSKAALEKAKFMFQKNFWAHTSPDGTEPWYFVLNQGYDYSFAGENLARNFNSSSEVVNAWINSSSHRENLISDNYDEIGFGVVNGVLDGYETTLVVQFFGKPRDPSTISTIQEQERYILSLNEKTGENKVLSNKESNIVYDVSEIFKYLAFSIIGFVAALFFFDIYYSKKHNIDKFTGHTSAHLLMIFAVIISLLVILKNGQVL
jgi:hypothetical protein